MARARFFETLEPRQMLNGAPVARDDRAYFTAVDTALQVTTQNAGILANDFDAEGSALTATIVANPAHGTISNFDDEAGTFTYTPDTSYVGVDAFTYKLNDGTSDGNTTTVAIAVGTPFGSSSNLDSAIQNPQSAILATAGLSLAQALTPGLALVYQSNTLPRPIVAVDTFLPTGATVPDEIKAELTFNSVAGDEVSYATTELDAGEVFRVALQADATSLATGRYAHSVKLTSVIDTTETEQTFTGSANVVNRGASTHPFGLGWQLAGLDQLFAQTGGVLLVQSDGGARWFADNGSGGYLKADGDTSFSTLVKNGDDSFTLTDKHGIKANFSSAGLLTSRVDRNSNTTSFSYTSGLLTQISDPFSRNTTLSYTSGRLTGVTDFASRSATLAYDGDGRLTSVTQPDPDGSGSLAAPVWSFAYDADSHRLNSATNPLSNATTFTYGSHGRLTSLAHPGSGSRSYVATETIGLPTGETDNALAAANPLGSLTDERSQTSTFRLDRFGNATEWNDPVAAKTLTERDANGLAVRTTRADPDGTGPLTSPVIVIGYDAVGNARYLRNPDNSTRTWTYSTSFNLPTAEVDELSRTQSFAYDSYGNMTSQTDGGGFVTTMTYNGRGLTTSVTRPDPDGSGSLTSSVTSMSYDSNGRLTTLTNPDSSTQTFAYDSADNLTSATDELSHSTTFAYDALARKTSVTDRVSATTSFVYNAFGQLTKETDALGGVTDHEYNARGFRTKTIAPDPDGAGPATRPESTFTYDGAGNLTQIGQWSYAGGTPVVYSYDSAGRKTKERRTLSSVNYDTDTTYDKLGRITKITDAEGHYTEFEYDSRDRLVKAIGQDPDGGGQLTSPVSTIEYDAAGQKTRETDPRGSQTDYSYDNRGLIASVTEPDPDGDGPMFRAISWPMYDNAGRLTSIQDVYCRTTFFAYDSRDRQTTETGHDPDGGGSQSAPVTTTAYDAGNRVTSVTDPLSRVTSYAYDHEGRTTSVTQPDPDGSGSLTSPVTSYAYNALGKVTSVTDPRSYVTTIAYDALQRQTTVTQPDPDGGGSQSAPVTTYVYSGGLLNKITDPLGHDTTFGYDGIGRKNSVKDHQNHETIYEFNKVDLVKKVTLPDPDGTGSQTSPVTEYLYDVYNRITKTTDPNGGQTQFTYDVAGNLLTVKDPVNNTTSYAYDGLDRLSIETNPLSKARSFYYDAVGRQVRKVDRNGRVMFFDYDELDRLTTESWLENANPVPVLSVATTSEGGPRAEVQRVGFTAMHSGGTFTLSLSGQTTSAIARNASAATVRTALEALSTIGTGNVAVTKIQDTTGAQEWKLTFQNAKNGLDLAQTTIDTANVTYSGGSLTNIQATDTTGGVFDEVQTVTISNADDGEFRLAFAGQIAAPLAQDATSSQVEAALEALAAVDQVTVTGNAGGPWTITFAGTHAQLNQPAINGDASSLQSGTSLRDVIFSYNAANQLTAASDPDSGYDYTYDNLGRLLTVDNDDTPDVARVILTNAYDAASNRTSLKASIGGTNDFQNAYTYDNLNRLTRVDQTAQGSASVAEKRIDFAYNSLGQFTSLARFKDTDGVSSNEVATTSFTYDTINRLTEIAHKKASTNLVTPYSYTYDNLSSASLPLPLGEGRGEGRPAQDPRVAALARGAVSSGLGRITQLVSADGTASYSYDKTSQLTGADYTAQTDETYTYDANGNRTMSGYSTGTNNRLLDDGTYTYEYDDEGNRTLRTKTSDDSTTEYAWDYRNRLVSVTNKNASDAVTQVVAFTYDVFNRRISRALDTTSPFDLADAAIERYVLDDLHNAPASLDGGNVILDFDGDEASDLARRYLYGNEVDQLLAQENLAESNSDPDRTYWPLTDHLQTVHDLAANDGTIAEHFTYDAYGKLLSGDTSLTRYLYTSRELDPATSLQYNRSRWYDSQTGRWITHDPKQFTAGDPNISRYVANFPVQLTDPTGHDLLDTYSEYFTYYTGTQEFYQNVGNSLAGSMSLTSAEYLASMSAWEALGWTTAASTLTVLSVYYAAPYVVTALQTTITITLPTSFAFGTAVTTSGTTVLVWGATTTTVTVGTAELALSGIYAYIIYMASQGASGADREMFNELFRYKNHIDDLIEQAIAAGDMGLLAELEQMAARLAEAIQKLSDVLKLG